MHPRISYYAVDKLYSGGISLNINHATINATQAGANTIVTGVAGKSILVPHYLIVASGTVTISWESEDGTVIGGPITFSATAGGGAAMPFLPIGHFKTKPSQSLVLFLSGGIQVGGHLVYVLF